MARQPENPAGGTRAFDWAAAHARLAQAMKTVEAAADPSAEQVREVLRERAARLAMPRKVSIVADEIDLILFRLGSERYAIEAGQIVAAVEVTGLLPVPGLPPFYLGFISHRGAIYPVVDFRLLFGLPGGKTAISRAIVANAAGNAVAIAADVIDGFARIEASQTAPIPEGRGRHIAMQGLTADGAIVLDIERLFQDARLVVDEQPVRAGATEEGAS